MSDNEHNVDNSMEDENSYRFMTASYINLAVFIFVLFFMGILSFIMVKPKTSELEKRDLAELPVFSAADYFSGAYTTALGSFFSDTFPFRDFFVGFGKYLDELRGYRPDDVRIFAGNNSGGEDDRIITAESSSTSSSSAPDSSSVSSGETSTPSSSEPESEPESSMSTEFMPDENAIGEVHNGIVSLNGRGIMLFGGSRQAGTRYAGVVSKFKELLPSVNVYNTVVPTSAAFWLPDKYKSMSGDQKVQIDHIYSSLTGGVIPVDAYSEMEKHKGEYIFFNTDHHWTGLGAYYAYTAFCRSAGFEPLKKTDFTTGSIEGFVGSLYGFTGDIKLRDNPDTFEYFGIPGSYTAKLFRKGAPDYAVPAQVFYPEVKGGNCYGYYLGGDYPLIRIDNPEVQNGRRIIVFKESYGNAFAPYLLSHFEQVYIADMRYFQKNAIRFIQNNSITDVLCINNVFAANTGVQIDRLEWLIYREDYVYQPEVKEAVQGNVTEADVSEQQESE